MPRQNRHSMCVRERVLRATGGIDTILLDERYTPYDRQPPRIENLCGSFTEYVPSAGLHGVLSQSSCQRELFHLHGNVVLSQVILIYPHTRMLPAEEGVLRPSQGRGAFLAVRGIDGLEALSKALRLSSAGNTVHMVVLTSKIGKRAQVSSAGLLETSLNQQKGQVRPADPTPHPSTGLTGRGGRSGSWEGSTSIPTLSASRSSGLGIIDS